VTCWKKLAFCLNAALFSFLSSSCLLFSSCSLRISSSNWLLRVKASIWKQTFLLVQTFTAFADRFGYYSVLAASFCWTENIRFLYKVSTCFKGYLVGVMLACLTIIECVGMVQFSSRLFTFQKLRDSSMKKIVILLIFQNLGWNWFFSFQLCSVTVETKVQVIILMKHEK